jgi:8-amino-7-oxononanoate synthase
VKPKFQTLLENRKKTGGYRSLSLFTGFVDFFSNDYLGLSKVSFPTKSFIDSEKYSLSFGSTGSRLLSGNSIEAEECESFLSSHFNAEAALVYNSGYDANLGLFSSVPQKGDTIIYDSLIHASIREGIRLSHAKSYSFEHNCLIDLEKKLKLAEGTIFVAVEGLYSMDGDVCLLGDMVAICERYNALLIVDEAHSSGVMGREGKGLSIEYPVFARLITFGKAYGCHGAAILGSRLLKEFLINFSRSFIYTTALPPDEYLRIRNSVAFDTLSLRDKLKENIAYFISLINMDLISDINSPIQIISVNDEKKAIELASLLQSNKFAVKPILSPTVKAGEERLRICIHAFNTEEEIALLVKLLRS